MVRPVRDIEPNEEITMNYLTNTCEPLSSREHYLQGSFGFTCQCQRCITERISMEAGLKPVDEQVLAMFTVSSDLLSQSLFQPKDKLTDKLCSNLPPNIDVDQLVCLVEEYTRYSPPHHPYLSCHLSLILIPFLKANKAHFSEDQHCEYILRLVASLSRAYELVECARSLKRLDFILLGVSSFHSLSPAKTPSEHKKREKLKRMVSSLCMAGREILEVATNVIEDVEERDDFEPARPHLNHPYRLHYSLLLSFVG